MNMLLDTNVFIHWVLDTDRLSKSIYETLINQENILFLSKISIWEIQIKSSLGKLDIGGHLPEVVSEQVEKNGLIILDLSIDHIYTLDRLMPHHRDPFDRLLIAQAIFDNLPIATTDRIFDLYDVQIVR